VTSEDGSSSSKAAMVQTVSATWPYLNPTWLKFSALNVLLLGNIHDSFWCIPSLESWILNRESWILNPRQYTWLLLVHRGDARHSKSSKPSRILNLESWILSLESQAIGIFKPRTFTWSYVDLSSYLTATMQFYSGALMVGTKVADNSCIWLWQLTWKDNTRASMSVLLFYF